MWWLKAIVSALVIINIGSGNPILNNEELHNIEENKFREVPAIKQKTKLVDAEESYRLPNTSIPLSYDITIRTDIHNAIFDFSGYVKIHAKILEATEEIVLHYRQIEIDYVDLFNSIGENVASDLKFEKISKFEFLNITLPRIYNPDEEIILEIAYHGEIRRDGGGFYYGSYTNEEGQNVYYATTQFEVTDARHAMPCYDEPGIRAPMTLTIIHGKKYSAVANMNIDSQENQGGYTVTKFKPTPSIQTYLLAFLISDFDYVSATNNSRISQKIYAKPEAIKNGEGDFAASVVGDVLARLEEVLKFNYPNDKMDHAALNYFNFGAMENFGLITYIDRGLLLNPSLTENQKYISQNSITGLIAHEFAHQWFGNIISPKWWTYTWLNEGFATLFASYIPHLIYPERNIFARGYINNIRTAFANDVNNSWAMNHYTELPNELWSKFGAIGYQKSGCVLRMFMEVMTREVFFNGLNYYLTANNMQAATPAELHVGLQTAYDQANFTTPLNIDQLMSTWENQAGYPLVTVTISGNNLQFSQRRYPSGNGEIYLVPLTIATKTNPNFNNTTPKQWLLTQNATFTQSELEFNTTNNDWMILNIQQVGYYRVDYDTALWQAIISQLNENHEEIHSINRAILQEEIALAWTEFNRVTVAHILEILNYFDKEFDSITWSKAYDNLNRLNERLFGTYAYDTFLEFVVRITENQINEIGYNGFDGEDPERTSLRSFIKPWNCWANYEKCSVQDHAEFLKYYIDGNQLAVFDYCNAIKLVNKTMFDDILNNVLTNSVFANRILFLANLGCSPVAENLQNLLNSILNVLNTLTRPERAQIIANTYTKSSIALEITLDFLDQNAAALHDIMGEFIEQLLMSMPSYINGQKNTAKYQSILTKFHGFGLISNENLNKATDSVASNNAWITQNYKNILDYFGLEEITDPPTTTPNTTPIASTPSQTSTAASDEPTTLAPTTTTQGASSIMVSMFIMFLCVITSFIFTK